VIKFGTDGWRGIISKDFTFENLRRVAKAHALSLIEEGKRRVVIGYDLRFLSEEYAREVAGVFSASGLEATLAESFAPTPAVSYATRYAGFDAGVVITASHNPAQYNGYKVKEDFGGAATTQTTKKIEEKLKEVKGEVKTAQNYDVRELKESYVEGARSQVELSLFKEREIKIVHDPMFGAQQGLLSQALRGTRAEVIQIHSYRDALFGGLHPEPIVEKNLKALKEKVRATGADLGIAHDGDGDRVGVVDEEGRFVNSQIVFALLLLHVVKNKGKREGVVVKTVSSGYLVDRICKKYGIELLEVPVGFKNITEVMLKRKVLFGGEESGGYALMDYLPERDGLLMALLLIEKMVAEGKKLSQMVEELFEEFGRAYYIREDLPVSDREREALERLKKNPPKGAERALTIDGLKLIFKDDSWILFRPSGTEPLFRVYAEAETEERARELIEWGKSLLRGGK